MVFGAILAGGTGQRMGGTSLPKQFLDLCGRPVLLHSLEEFLSCAKIDSVYLGIHKEWVSYVQTMLAEYMPDRAGEITVVCGGEDRNTTLFNVIAKIEEDHGDSEEHIIVSHDAVRPFVTRRMIEENIAAAEEYGAADTVIPAVDTIVRSEDGVTIDSVPDRRQLYQSQTPQSFRIRLLKKLYATLSAREREQMTDACRICVIRDHPVHLVPGSDTNIKITTPGDLKIAQALAREKDQTDEAIILINHSKV